MPGRARSTTALSVRVIRRLCDAVEPDTRPERGRFGCLFSLGNVVVVVPVLFCCCYQLRRFRFTIDRRQTLHTHL